MCILIKLFKTEQNRIDLKNIIEKLRTKRLPCGTNLNVERSIFNDKYFIFSLADLYTPTYIILPVYGTD